MQSDSIITFFIILLILHLFLLLGLKYLYRKESYSSISANEKTQILEDIYQTNLTTYVEMRRINSPKTHNFLDQVYIIGNKIGFTKVKIDEDIFNLLTSSPSLSPSPSPPSLSPSQ